MWVRHGVRQMVTIVSSHCGAFVAALTCGQGKGKGGGGDLYVVGSTPSTRPPRPAQQARPHPRVRSQAQPATLSRPQPHPQPAARHTPSKDSPHCSPVPILPADDACLTRRQ